MSEAMQIDYNHQTTYDIDPQNQVGTDADHEVRFPGKANVRTLPTVTGDIAYVRKFGTQYLITQVTDIEDPVDVNMTFTVKALDGTTLGSRTGGGAFSAGSTLATAQGCYLVISASGGAVTVLASITIDTDVDAGGLAFTCPAESVADTTSLTLYLSDTGSTYYDSAMKYGGARHTPALATSRKPYFHPYDAAAALNSNYDAIEIVDSETYALPYMDSGGTLRYEIDMNRYDSALYSSAGETPTIKYLIGSSAYTEQPRLANNTNTIFLNENGDDGTGDGSWQNPYLTINTALAAAGAGDNVVYGGTGATVSGGTLTSDNTTDFADFWVFPEYGYTPNFAISTWNPDISDSARVCGWYFNAANQGLDLTASNSAVIWCNSIIMTFAGGDGIQYASGIDFSGIISNNRIIGPSSGQAISLGRSGGEIDAIITKNIIDNFQHGVWLESDTAAQTTTGTVYDNIITNCDYGILLDVTNGTLSSTVRNNTLYGNGYGIKSEQAAPGTYSATVRDNIIRESTTVGLHRTGTQPTITESCYDTNAASANDWTIDASCFTTDPQFVDEDNNNFALSPDSPCYRSGTSSYDIGAILRMVEINNDYVEFNGIIFDGNNYANNGIYILDNAHHLQCELKWCNVKNCNGIANDIYDTGNSYYYIRNSIVADNGSGVRFAQGNNTISQSLIYNNTNYGIYSYESLTIDHSVVANNNIGMYLMSDTSLTMTNSITAENMEYGIYANVAVAPTYSCIYDGYNSYVDVSASSNVPSSPLFTDSENDDYTLKSEEDGYSIGSACIDAGDDGKDIGAYDVNREIEDDSWKKYTLEHAPRSMAEKTILSNSSTHEDIYGNVTSYYDDDKLVFPLEWSDNSMTSATQRKKIKYFQTLIPSRKNGKKTSECEFRIHPLPTTYNGTGTTGVVDASELTLTDSSKEWVENEKKGWHVTIKFDEGTETGTITASTKKIQVSPSPSWTDDEWIGYYFHYNGYYYYIIDNDADELTLSDTNSTLSDASNVSWEITKQFRVESNTETELTLIDDGGELVDGTYGYMFDYVLCNVMPNDFEPSQEVYSYDEAHNNFLSGYSITFREIE